MSEQETTIWGIHAGELGQADGLFKKNYVALGWSQMGDLGMLPADREAFKKKVAETYPDSKPGAIPDNAGQLFRFVHEMKPGDLIVYPYRIVKYSWGGSKGSIPTIPRSMPITPIFAQ